MQIEITGLEQLARKMEDIINGDKINKGVNALCEYVRDQAVLLCPVDTGELRQSIKVEVKDNAGEVYTNCEYAPYVEYGTGRVGATAAPEGAKVNGITYTDKEYWTYTPDGGNSFYTTSGQPAQPFMYPAYKKGMENAAKIITREMLK